MTEPSQEQEPEKTYTQADVNKAVQERLRRDREKTAEQYADYEALKDKAAKYDELAEASKSELQKALERAELAERTAREKDGLLLRSEVSRETGVPLAALHGDTEEQVRATAEALLAWRDEGRKSASERAFASFSSGASGSASGISGKDRAAEMVRGLARTNK
jgi:hypothetical protein